MADNKGKNKPDKTYAKTEGEPAVDTSDVSESSGTSAIAHTPSTSAPPPSNSSSSSSSRNANLASPISSSEVKLAENAVKEVKAALNIPEGLAPGGDVFKVTELLDEKFIVFRLSENALYYAFWCCLHPSVSSSLTKFLQKHKLAPSVNDPAPYTSLRAVLPQFFKSDVTADVYLERFMSIKYKVGSNVDAFIIDKEKSFVDWITYGCCDGFLSDGWRDLTGSHKTLIWCTIKSCPNMMQEKLIVALSQLPRDTWTVEILRQTMLTLEHSGVKDSSAFSTPKGSNGGNPGNKAKSGSAPNTPSKDGKSGGNAGGGIICHNCGRPGHKRPDCPDFIKKSPQAGSTSSSSSSSSSSSNSGGSSSSISTASAKNTKIPEPNSMNLRGGKTVSATPPGFKTDVKSEGSFMGYLNSEDGEPYCTEPGFWGTLCVADDTLEGDARYLSYMQADAFFDSGSKHSIIRVGLAHYFATTVTPSPDITQVKGVNNAIVELVGRCWLSIGTRRTHVGVDFLVVPDDFPVPFLIGREAMKDLETVFDFSSQTLSVLGQIMPVKRLPDYPSRVDSRVPPRSSLSPPRKEKSPFKRVHFEDELPSGWFSSPTVTSKPDIVPGHSALVGLQVDDKTRVPVEDPVVASPTLVPRDGVVNGVNLYVNPELHGADLEAAEALVHEFEHIFYHDGVVFTGAHGHVHNIHTTGPIKYFGDRRYSPRQTEVIDKNVDIWARSKIIEDCHSGIANNPPVVVSKDHGKDSRVCFDFRPLNGGTERDPYPMPRVDSFLEWLGGCDWTTVCDLKSAYMQVILAEADRPKTAFRWRNKRYQFRCMPFGLVGAQDTMQRLMDDILSPVASVARCYVDDICIGTRGSYLDHLAAIRSVFEILAKNLLYLGTKHIYVAFRAVPALGHLAGRGRIRIPTDRIAAFAAMIPPKDRKELASFLSTVGFYRKFFQGFANVALPLTNLLKKDTEWIWSQLEQSSFDALKDLMTQPPVLFVPDYTKSFLIRCDASGYAIGAALLQEHDGMFMPVAYMSRKLIPAEINYTTTEKECLAVVKSIDEWFIYIDGCPLMVETDHIALQTILSMKEPSGRLARWIMRLQSIPFTIKHRPGKLMSLPDSLSRLISTDQYSLVAVLTASQEKDGTMLVAQRSDPVISEVVAFLEKGTPMDDPDALALANECSTMLEIHEGLLYLVPPGKRGRSFERRVVVPLALQNLILKENHESALSGHFGFMKTYGRIKKSYFWRRMWSDVTEYCADCIDCAQAKQASQRLTGELQASFVGRPWSRVYTDFIGPLPLTPRGNRYILTFFDVFTGWPEAFATAEQTAAVFADKVLSEIVSRHDPPSEFFSDNGPAFIDAGVERLMELIGSQHIFTAPYHPQANASERLNKTLEVLLRPLVRDHPEDWDIFLPLILRAIRTVVNPKTGFSPYFLVYGHEPVAPVELALGLYPPESSVDDFANEIVGNLHVALDEAVKASERARQVVQKALDSREVAYDFSIGDWVMVEEMQYARGVNAKLAMPYTGPYVILERVDINTYTLDMPKGPTPVHVKRFKPFYGNPPAPIELDPVEDDSIAIDPPKGITNANVVGKRIRVWWPKFHEWLDGTVVNRDKKRHVVRYDFDNEEYIEKLIGYNPRVSTKWMLLVPRDSVA
jgi:hypothetical protein